MPRSAQGHVDRSFERIAEVAVLEQVHIAFDHPFQEIDVGLVGDVAKGAADASRSEQRALRPTQCFDAVEVKQIEVGREQRQ